MKTYGVSCTLLLMVEAENEDAAVAYAEAMLNETHYYAEDFNDIEPNFIKIFSIIMSFI